MPLETASREKAHNRAEAVPPVGVKRVRVSGASGPAGTAESAVCPAAEPDLSGQRKIENPADNQPISPELPAPALPMARPGLRVPENPTNADPQNLRII